MYCTNATSILVRGYVFPHSSIILWHLTFWSLKSVKINTINSRLTWLVSLLCRLETTASKFQISNENPQHSWVFLMFFLLRLAPLIAVYVSLQPHPVCCDFGTAWFQARSFFFFFTRKGWKREHERWGGVRDMKIFFMSAPGKRLVPRPVGCFAHSWCYTTRRNTARARNYVIGERST